MRKNGGGAVGCIRWWSRQLGEDRLVREDEGGLVGVWANEKRMYNLCTANSGYNRSENLGLRRRENL